MHKKTTRLTSNNYLIMLKKEQLSGINECDLKTRNKVLGFDILNETKCFHLSIFLPPNFFSNLLMGYDHA